ncbi:MAG: XRE family transcriptional regulator [Bacteroidales bacterium]|nr:XRE family transcriptional regulator [Bacteroidales bacterium]
MNQEIAQIAERLKGLREVLEIGIDEISQICGISQQQYKDIESGKVDIPVSILQRISQHYNIELATLMFGDEARMSSYYLTRAGKGPAVERTKAYKYQALATGFKDRRVNPFIVTVEPDDKKEMTLNSHPGQEFNLIIKGTMLININGKELVLNQGDSIYFDSSLSHGMKALNNQTVQFLAIIM